MFNGKSNLLLSYVLFSLQKSTKRLATGYYIFVICRFTPNDIKRCRSSLFHQQMSKYSVYGCEFFIKSLSPIYGVSLVHCLEFSLRSSSHSLAISVVRFTSTIPCFASPKIRFLKRQQEVRRLALSS